MFLVLTSFYEFAHLIVWVLNVGGMCIFPQKNLLYMVTYFVYNTSFSVSV